MTPICEIHSEEKKWYLSQKKFLCKSCNREAQRQYRKDRPGDNAKRVRDWRRQNPERWKEICAAWLNKNPDKYLAAVIKKYGMTVAEYWELFMRQNGVCASCRRPEEFKKYLSVDHDHNTGERRGLLCSNCNTAAGLLKDDPARMRALAEYIEQYRNQV